MTVRSATTLVKQNRAAAVGSQQVERGHARAAVDALLKVERSAHVARPERVAAESMALARRLDLLDGVHREPPRPLQPKLVSQPLEQRQEGAAVTGRAVTEAGALGQRAGLPGQLGARRQQF